MAADKPMVDITSYLDYFDVMLHGTDDEKTK